MKIVNFLKFIRSTLLILGIIVLGLLFINNSSLSYGELNKKIIYICDGDTLWNIAKNERDNNKYYTDKDIRYIIEDIKEINSLQNSDLLLGQKLEIPEF